MKRITKMMMSLFLLSALLGCGMSAKEASAEQTRTKDIAILYTGDVHVSLDGDMGYDSLSALKTEMTDDGMEVLLVDTGDAIQGTPVGKLSLGQIPIEIMNELGYSAMTLGNHEFDYGMETLEGLSQQAQFPFLSLNLKETTDEKSVYKPYTIVERDGAKIAFVGVSTPKTITSSTPAFFQNENGQFIYTFLQDESGEMLWSAVQQNVDAAKSEGADYIVAMTHLGIDGTTSPYLSTAMIENTSGIDVVLDGHSHSVIACERVKNKEGKWVLLSATGSRFENIGYLLLEQDGNISTGLIQGYQNKDARITSFVEEKKAAFDEILKKAVADIGDELVVEDPETGVRIVRNAETNLGSLCADAIRTTAGADIAVQNGGGVRENLSAGTVSYGDVLSVLPFGNEICMIEVTGQQILDALELSVSAVPNEFGGFLQVSGLTFTFRTELPSPVKRDENNLFAGIEGERRVQTVLVGGMPLDPAASYTLAGAEYTLLSGGDGYTMFADSKVVKTQVAVDYDVLIDYLTGDYRKNSQQYENPYGEGRIVAAP